MSGYAFGSTNQTGTVGDYNKEMALKRRFGMLPGGPQGLPWLPMAGTMPPPRPGLPQLPPFDGGGGGGGGQVIQSGGTPSFGGIHHQSPMDAHPYGDSFATENTGADINAPLAPSYTGPHGFEGLDTGFYNKNPGAEGEMFAKQTRYEMSRQGWNPDVARADGGPFNKGQKVLVGERGPEVVCPMKSFGNRPPPSGVKVFYANNPQAKTAATLENEKLAAHPEIRMPIRLPQFVEPLTLPHRAKGGDVEEDQPYVVGEHGPEVIVPKKDGYVVPNEHLPATLENVQALQRRFDEIGDRLKGVGSGIEHSLQDINTFERGEYPQINATRARIAQGDRDLADWRAGLKGMGLAADDMEWDATHARGWGATVLDGPRASDTIPTDRFLAAANEKAGDVNAYGVLNAPYVPDPHMAPLSVPEALPAQPLEQLTGYVEPSAVPQMRSAPAFVPPTDFPDRPGPATFAGSQSAPQVSQTAPTAGTAAPQQPLRTFGGPPGKSSFESMEQYKARREAANPENINVGFTARKPLTSWSRPEALTAGKEDGGGGTREERAFSRMKREVIRAAHGNPRLASALLSGKAAAEAKQQQLEAARVRNVFNQNQMNARNQATIEATNARAEATAKARAEERAVENNFKVGEFGMKQAKFAMDSQPGPVTFQRADGTKQGVIYAGAKPMGIGHSDEAPLTDPMEVVKGSGVYAPRGKDGLPDSRFGTFSQTQKGSAGLKFPGLNLPWVGQVVPPIETKSSDPRFTQNPKKATTESDPVKMAKAHLDAIKVLQDLSIKPGVPDAVRKQFEAAIAHHLAEYYKGAGIPAGALNVGGDVKKPSSGFLKAVENPTNRGAE